MQPIQIVNVFLFAASAAALPYEAHGAGIISGSPHLYVKARDPQCGIKRSPGGCYNYIKRSEVNVEELEDEETYFKVRDPQCGIKRSPGGCYNYIKRSDIE